jgi:methylglutaconyl-CoA hydratase
MEEKILFTIDDQNVARLTLNRPEVHNAFDNEMIEKLIEYFRKLQEMPSVRALVIRGNGKSFCAGADLSWIKRSFQGESADSFENARNLSMMLYSLDNLLIPTFSYIHGVVMGGGIGIAACSDIVFSDSETVFSFPETKLGFAPAIVSPFVLRAIGSRYARRYFLTGEPFNALEAHHMGLVHKIVDEDSANAEIEGIVARILENGQHAVVQAKKLIQKLTGEITESTRLMTIELIDALCRTEEGQQRVAAFLEKANRTGTPKQPYDD